VSQFYFQQAFNNVMFGAWKKIAEPYGKMVLGYFGRTPVPPDPDVVNLAREQLNLEPTTRGVLELNDADPSKGVDAAKKILQDERLPVTDENIFIAAACQEKGIRFLKGEAEIGVRKIDKETAAGSSAHREAKPGQPAEFIVTVNGEDIFMAFEGNMVTVDGKVYHVGIKPQPAGEAAAPPAGGVAQLTEIKAQMPGAVYKQLVHAGDHVRIGEAILILEAMKMEMEVASPVDGTVDEVRFAVGDQVHTGQVLATIKK
jgi:pyruvate carboxylase subunit B